MKKRILSVGEIIWDVYPEKQVIGGAPLNFAAHAARLGAESSLLSAVAEDALGDAALRALENFGVGTAWVGRNARPTGQCTVSLDANGVPHYDVLRDMAYDHIRLTPQAQADIRASRFDALYFGTLIQRRRNPARHSGRLLRTAAPKRFSVMSISVRGATMRSRCGSAWSRQRF